MSEAPGDLSRPRRRAAATLAMLAFVLVATALTTGLSLALVYLFVM